MTTTGRPSVLCVEDDQSGRACLSAALAEYDCSFAANAYEALRALHARPYDAYLLDYWLPDWSGPLLCREIRKHDPHAAVVFCSESASDVNRDRALRAGASAYLPKPIDAELLTEKLAALVQFAASEGERAAGHAERALEEELSRRGLGPATADGAAEALARLGSAARSVERTARARAYRAFIESGGTHARFDRWWAERRPALFFPGEAYPGDDGMRFMTRDRSATRTKLALYIDVFGGWRWEYFDERGEARDSRESFDTRRECFMDAERKGLAGRERTHARRHGTTPAPSAHRSATLTGSGSELSTAAHASGSTA